MVYLVDVVLLRVPDGRQALSVLVELRRQLVHVHELLRDADELVRLPVDQSDAILGSLDHSPCGLWLWCARQGEKTDLVWVSRCDRAPPSPCTWLFRNRLPPGAGRFTRPPPLLCWPPWLATIHELKATRLTSAAPAALTSLLCSLITYKPALMLIIGTVKPTRGARSQPMSLVQLAACPHWQARPYVLAIVHRFIDCNYTEDLHKRYRFAPSGDDEGDVQCVQSLPPGLPSSGTLARESRVPEKSGDAERLHPLDTPFPGLQIAFAVAVAVKNQEPPQYQLAHLETEGRSSRGPRS